MSVTKTEAFHTSDGRLFVSEEEANTHQLRLDLREWYSDNYLSSDFSRIDFDEVVVWVQTNAPQIRKILKLRGLD